MWELEYERDARKQLRAIRDRVELHRIEQALLQLRRNPRPAGVKKLSGHIDLWRIRVGDWRIVYRIEDGRLLILIVTVAKRGEVYRKLG